VNGQPLPAGIDREERIDAFDKVSGRTRYAADLERPDALWARALRSPLPHARIGRIDVERAAALPGVAAILTGRDLPDWRMGRAIRDMPVLARDRVRFAGEKVAVVAAETRAIAEQALTLIEVDYEELPAVFDPLEAMEPGAPLLHDAADIRAWAAPLQVVPDHPNGVMQRSWGASAEELEAALGASHRVVEHVVRTPRQHQVYLEPHHCLVEVDAAGITHIWATNKAPFLLTAYLEAGLGLAASSVRVHPLPLGGDFGGKGSFMDIPLAWLLARATGRPVRMAMSYRDELGAGNPRHAAIVRVVSGVDRDGRILARLVHAIFDSGAYAAFKPSLDAGLPEIRAGGCGPYEIPTARVLADVVYTNSVPGGHMRNPGAAQTTAAVEIHTDALARELGLDPIDLRRRHLAQRARRSDDGGVVPSRAAAVLDAAAAAIGWTEPRPTGVGRSVALSEMHTSPGIYSGALTLSPTGRAIVRTPIIENGAGMLTVLRRLTAEQLKVPVERVDVEQTTEGFTTDRGIGGSRVSRVESIVVRRLVLAAASRAREELAAAAGIEPDAIGLEDGELVLPGGERLTPLEAAQRLETAFDVTITYQSTDEDDVVVHVAQAAEVEVDRETGRVLVRRMVSVHDIGRVVNPVSFRGQIEGALAQGAGYALLEDLPLEDGHVTTLNLHDYRIPTSADLPTPQIVLLEPQPELGVTPVGESTPGMAPAIAGAVAEVVGVPMLELPLRPERVRSAAMRIAVEVPSSHTGPDAAGDPAGRS
jgi:CO/xanthine dehydrogenase Mo-binding subunit